MDTFFASPVSTTFSPFSPQSRFVVEDILTPILPLSMPGNSFFPNIPGNTYYPTIPRVNIVTGPRISSVYRPSNLFYYDSGIGENPLAQHETNSDLRYKFLDEWLYEDFPEILRMLKIEGNSVKVVSKSEVDNNDISKDSDTDLEKKSDFIGYEILTLRKNKKILDAICQKNNLKYYDLHSNKYLVRKEQGRYVLKHLKAMQT